MVFYNNNRVDQVFLNNANIVAIGQGTNTPALVYNNAATNAQLQAIGGSANVVSGFEIVNFNTLGINNIDFRVPFASGMNPTGATVYYNNARNNCLIESTTKDMVIFNLVDYGFCKTDYSSASLNSLTIYGAANSSNPTGYFTAKYVTCYERYGGASTARWYATENLNGMPYGRTPGYSNMAASNVLNLSGSQLTFGKYSTWTPDQLNITGATTAFLDHFNGGPYWGSDGGLRVLSGVATGTLNNSWNICTFNAVNAYINASYNVNYVNGTNVYVNASHDINIINGNYVQLNSTANNIANVTCYNLNASAKDFVANVSYFANVSSGTNVNLQAHHANINGGSNITANLASNTGVSYVTNTTNGYFNTNGDLFLNNVSNSNIFAKFVSYGSPSLNLVNNCQNCNFYIEQLGSQYISNFSGTYNAFRNCNIYTPSNNFALLQVYAPLSQVICKDAFFNASFYNYNLNNNANLGPTNFTWYSYTDAPHFANAFSYYAYPIVANATSNSKAYFNVMLPCGSNITGTCLVLGNAYNVGSYELRSEIHLAPNGYATNSGAFGPYAYYNQNGHDTYICSSNLNNFNNRKFVVMGLGLGSVSYPNGIAAEKYMNALNTALLHYSVPNCTVANAWMVQIPSAANSLNGNWVRFRDCGPVYSMAENSSTIYAFENTPNACFRGSGNIYINSNMNIAIYNSFSRNYFIPDDVGQVHFDIKGTNSYYTSLGNIYLYNLSSTWNKNTSIYINAYDCKSLIFLGITQFYFTNRNMQNVKTIEIRAKNCVYVGDFNSNTNYYFNNTNMYFENCVLNSISGGRTVNIYSGLGNTTIKMVNCRAQYPITLKRAAGQFVTFNIINCTNITVVS